jgi:hypothetical protein
MLRRLFQRPDRRADDEFRDHIERLAADRIRAGLSPDEARRAAHLEFGGIDRVAEECRDVRGTRWIHDLVHDLRLAFRLLARERWFTLAAVMSLAAGIGATITMCSVIEAYYFRGLSSAAGEPIGAVETLDRAGRGAGVSYPDFLDWRRANGAFERLEAFAGRTVTVADEGLAPDSVAAAYVTAAAFDTIGERPILGRAFTADDDRVGAAPVALLGHRLWQIRFGGDPSVVGRALTVDGTTTTVVGVMPDGFEFPFREALWFPLATHPQLADSARDDRILNLFGRVRPGVTLRGSWSGDP